MTIRIPNEGEAVMLGIALGKLPVEDLRLRLYTNNITPSETDTMGTYTELTGNGYASVVLNEANWTIVEGAPSEATMVQVVFTFTGAAGNVYGYYVTGETTNKVRWAERFNVAPFVVAASGDQVKVTLKLTLQDTQD